MGTNTEHSYGLAPIKREGESYFVSELLGDGLRTISEMEYIESPNSIAIPWYIPFKGKVRSLINEAWKRGVFSEKRNKPKTFNEKLLSQ